MLWVINDKTAGSGTESGMNHMQKVRKYRGRVAIHVYKLTKDLIVKYFYQVYMRDLLDQISLSYMYPHPDFLTLPYHASQLSLC